MRSARPVFPRPARPEAGPDPPLHLSSRPAPVASETLPVPPPSPPAASRAGLSSTAGPVPAQLPALSGGGGVNPPAPAGERLAAEDSARRAVQRLFGFTAAAAAAWVAAWAFAGVHAARAIDPGNPLGPLLGAAAGVLWALGWLVVGHAGMARAWVRGDGSALAAWAGAEPLSVGFERYGAAAAAPALDPAEAGWVDIVRDAAQQLGLPRPKVFVWSAEPAINAVVAGWTPTTSALVVTRGALDKLSPREQRALATHQLLRIASGQARFQLAATSLLWGFAWVRLGGEHRRQPDARTGEPASALRHFIGSLQAGLGLLGVPLAHWLERRAAAGSHAASDDALAEACPDLRVPMATVLQKVWYEADSQTDRLRSARAAWLRPFLLASASGARGGTHPSLEGRVLRLSGQPGLPLPSGPLGAALEASVARPPAPTTGERLDPLAPARGSSSPDRTGAAWAVPAATAAPPNPPAPATAPAPPPASAQGLGEPWLEGVDVDEAPSDLAALFGHASAGDPSLLPGGVPGSALGPGANVDAAPLARTPDPVDLPPQSRSMTGRTADGSAPAAGGSTERSADFAHPREAPDAPGSAPTEPLRASDRVAGRPTALDHPIEDAVERAVEAAPAPEADRPVVAPARWAAALAAADARAQQADPSAEDADAAAAALGLARPSRRAGVAQAPAHAPGGPVLPQAPRPAAADLSPRPRSWAVGATGEAAAGVRPPFTPAPAPSGPSAAIRSRPPLGGTGDPPVGRFRPLPPEPDADSPEGRELARLVGMALPGARPLSRLGATGLPAPGTADPTAAPPAATAPAAPAPGAARRPQRWKRATVETTRTRGARRTAMPRRREAPSGFGSLSGWHSGFDPTSGFGPIAAFDPSDNTPLPDLPPIPPLPGAPTDPPAGLDRTGEAKSAPPASPPAERRPDPTRSAGRRPQAGSSTGPAPAMAASAASAAGSVQGTEPPVDLAGVLRPAPHPRAATPAEDPEAPLVRAALGLPVPGRVAAVPRASTGVPSAPSRPDTSDAGDAGFAPTEWMARPLGRPALAPVGPPAPAAPDRNAADTGRGSGGARSATDASRTSASGASAAMAAADETLVREAAGRLSRLAGREELRAAILSFMISTDSGRERAAWRTETGGSSAHARILDDLAAQPREAQLPWFGELVRRAAGGSLEERRAMVESARRVMTAAGVVKPLDRLRWLTLRHGLGASSRKPQVAPAAPPDDHTAFYRANLTHIATYTAFLARMIPVYAADVGIDPIGERWYQAVLQRFVGVGPLPPCRVPDSDSLVHALRALQSLSWLNRPPLVRAWVGEAIAHAGSAGLTADAADALFMTCLLLDSPMPGELARHFPTVGTAPAGARR